MLSMGNSFRDGVWGHNSVAQISTFAAAVTSGISYGCTSLVSVTGLALSSSKTVLSVTWKILSASLFYGLIVQIGIIQAKSLLCHLCQQYMNQISSVNFSLILGALTIALTLINLQIAKFVRRMMSNKKKLKGSRFRFRKTTKTTRSGRIYGYM